MPPALRDASGTFAEVVALAVAATNAQLRVAEALRGWELQRGCGSHPDHDCSPGGGVVDQ